jgi:hypothetical protein
LGVFNKPRNRIPPNTLLEEKAYQKRIVPSTSLQITNVKQKEKEYKLSDGSGLYLLITPSGGKLWRLKYGFGGKEKLLSFGSCSKIISNE